MPRQTLIAQAVAMTPVLFLVSVLVPSTSAQPPAENQGAPRIMRGVLGRGIDPLPVPRDVLILLPSVQDELQLSKTQRERIATLDREGRELSEQLFQVYRANLLPPDQVDPQVRQILMQQLVAARASVRNRTETETLNVLESRQLTRLDQIQLQAQGPIAFSRPEVLEKLNLSPDQTGAIQDIVARGQEEMWTTSAVPWRVPPGDGPLTPERYRALFESEQFKAELEKAREATMKARNATMQAITKALTEGQRETYRKMLGEPFDLAKLRSERTTSAAETVKALKAEKIRPQSRSRPPNRRGRTTDDRHPWGHAFRAVGPSG